MHPSCILTFGCRLTDGTTADVATVLNNVPLNSHLTKRCNNDRLLCFGHGEGIRAGVWYLTCWERNQCQIVVMGTKLLEGCLQARRLPADGDDFNIPQP